MKIICKKCGEIFESLIIDKQLAWNEIFKASGKHVQHRHKAMFEEMQKAVITAVGALTVAMHTEEFCIIPEDEVRLMAIITTSQDVVMAAIGYDPANEEDEEFEDEDEDSVENDPQVGTVEVVTEEDKKEGVPINS